MAEVFLAESAGIEGFKKQVAIKRVLPHLSEKKRFIAMFLDEARLSAHLSHSNVAQVFDIGVGDNAYFIVMEYVGGSDLKASSVDEETAMRSPFRRRASSRRRSARASPTRTSSPDANAPVRMHPRHVAA
jgi:serine/threonine protein kinase